MAWILSTLWSAVWSRPSHFPVHGAVAQASGVKAPGACAAPVDLQTKRFYSLMINAFVPSRIVLRRQGVVGDLVLNSVVINNNNAGSFQVQNNRLLGDVLGAPLAVETSNSTKFTNVNGLGAIQSGGSMSLATYGLILKDPVSGNPTMYAHRVILLQ